MFLLEIVIIILFFFHRSRRMHEYVRKGENAHRESAELSAAVMLVQESAETFRQPGNSGGRWFTAQISGPWRTRKWRVALKAGPRKRTTDCCPCTFARKKRHGAFRAVDTARYGGTHEG